jgi:hypothetical protein
VHLVGNPFAATIAARESAQVICRRDAVVTYRDTLYLYHRVASLSNDYGRSSPGLVQRSGQHDWWAGGECLTTYKRSMVRIAVGRIHGARLASRTQGSNA